MTLTVQLSIVFTLPAISASDKVHFVDYPHFLQWNLAANFDLYFGRLTSFLFVYFTHGCRHVKRLIVTQPVKNTRVILFRLNCVFATRVKTCQYNYEVKGNQSIMCMCFYNGQDLILIGGYFSN